MTASADLIETCLALIVIVLGLAWPEGGRRIFLGLQRVLSPLENRPRLAIFLAFLLPVLSRLLLLAWHPAPLARTMEEHNNLLQSDMYAHGHLANPVHPLAVVLQSYQTIEWPHRMSSRPPLSALFLYLGQLLLGSPFFGNMLSVGVASACLFWMLMGWMPRRWALLGSLIVVVNFTVFGYWMNSYWAPTVPVIGGALLLGLAPRILKRSKPIHAVAFTIGSALLLGTRPYEGLICVAIIGSWLLVNFLGRDERHLLGRRLKTFVLPAACGAILIMAVQLGYNQLTTGKAAMMPYQIWRTSQTAVPPFLWQPISTEPLIFYHEGARFFAEWEISRVSPLHQGTVESYTLVLARHSATLREIVGPLLIIPLLCWSSSWFSRRPRRWQLALFAAAAVAIVYALCRASGIYRSFVLLVLLALILRWRERKYRLPLLVVLGGALATSLSSFYMNNYFLPFLPALILLIVVGLRNLHAWDRVHGSGASLTGFVILGSVSMLLIQIGGSAIGRPFYGLSDLGRFDVMPLKGPAWVAEQLRQRPGKDLVLVRYEYPDNSTREFVWNLADPDRQDIIWARDLRPEWSAAAINHYEGRKIWLLRSFRNGGVVLAPYPLDRLPPPPPLSSLPIPDMPKEMRRNSLSPALNNPSTPSH